jgi:plasmid stabilization system protein ParE
MSYRLVVSPEAFEQAEAVDQWWRFHRSAAPDLFTEELAQAFQNLQAVPFLIGRRFLHDDIPDLRRLILRATRYHIYYRVAGEAVLILAVWSAVRGTGPDLSPFGA